MQCKRIDENAHASLIHRKLIGPERTRIASPQGRTRKKAMMDVLMLALALLLFAAAIGYTYACERL